MMLNDIYLIAITGSIASGKSMASNFLKISGYETIDFDKLGHYVLEEDKVAKDMIIEEFGLGILDSSNKIDRKKLGNIVFSNKVNIQRLNSITHPRIYDLAIQEINKLKNEKVIFLEIPLLFETRNRFSEFYELIDEIWLISTKEEVQLSRLMIRDKIPMEEAKERIEAQLKLSIKEKLADIVIYNNDDLEDLFYELRIELENLERRIQTYEK